MHFEGELTQNLDDTRRHVTQSPNVVKETSFQTDRLKLTDRKAKKQAGSEEFQGGPNAPRLSFLPSVFVRVALPFSTLTWTWEIFAKIAVPHR